MSSSFSFRRRGSCGVLQNHPGERRQVRYIDLHITEIHRLPFQVPVEKCPHRLEGLVRLDAVGKAFQHGAVFLVHVVLRKIETYDPALPLYDGDGPEPGLKYGKIR
jgi:hypothetical protein